MTDTFEIQREIDSALHQVARSLGKHTNPTHLDSETALAAKNTIATVVISILETLNQRMTDRTNAMKSINRAIRSHVDSGGKAP